MARARSLRRLRLSRSVWDCQRLLSVLLLSTRSFQRCAGRHVGPRNSLVLLLIKKIFFASGGAAQARGRFSDFSQVPDLSLPPSTRSPRPAGTQLVIQLYHHQSIRLAEKTFVSAELHPKTNPVVPYVRPLIKKTTDFVLRTRGGLHLSGGRRHQMSPNVIRVIRKPKTRHA